MSISTESINIDINLPKATEATRPPGSTHVGETLFHCCCVKCCVKCCDGDDVAIERILKGRPFENLEGIMIIVIVIKFRNSKFQPASQPASQPAEKHSYPKPSLLGNSFPPLHSHVHRHVHCHVHWRIHRQPASQPASQPAGLGGGMRDSSQEGICVQ